MTPPCGCSKLSNANTQEPSDHLREGIHDASGRARTPSASCPMGSRSSPETAGGGFPAKKPCGATREEPPVSALAGVTKPWRTCVLRSTRAPPTGLRAVPGSNSKGCRAEQ